jgi:hypothetical protein
VADETDPNTEALAREMYGATGGRMRLQDADPQTQARYRAEAQRVLESRYVPSVNKPINCPVSGCELVAGPLYAIDGTPIREVDSVLSSLMQLVEHLREDHAAVPPWEVS